MVYRIALSQNPPFFSYFFPSSLSFSFLPNFSNQTIASFVNFFFFPSKEFELGAGKELWPNHLADLWSTDMHYFVALGFPHACNATHTQLTTSRTRKNPSHSSNSTAAQTIRGEERGWSLIQTMWRENFTSHQFLKQNVSRYHSTPPFFLPPRPFLSLCA